jgi:hypothetical protein
VEERRAEQAAKDKAFLSRTHSPSDLLPPTRPYLLIVYSAMYLSMN